MSDTYKPQFPETPKVCNHCKQTITAGSCFMEHINNATKWHIGCFQEAIKGKPWIKLLCKVRCK